MTRSRRGHRAPGAEGAFLLEFRRVGNAVKVSAIDPVTGTEVSISGPADIGEAELSLNACNKLRYVLRKKFGSDTTTGSARPRGIKA